MNLADKRKVNLKIEGFLIRIFLNFVTMRITRSYFKNDCYGHLPDTRSCSLF